MYLIRNISNQEIALGDLRIALKSGQQIDLDMICSRYVAEQSPSLKVFLKRSMLKIVSKDTPFAGKQITVKEVHVTTPPANEEILKEMREQEKRLIERQEILIKKHLGDAAAKSGIDPKAMEALQSAIAALQGIAVSGGPQTVSKSSDAGDAIEDGTAVEIQKRTLDRLSKNSQGSIKHEESKSKSNVDSNIEELGDLL